MSVNSQYFDQEQIKSGEMQKLLTFLMDEAYGNGKYYNDLHIYPADCGAFIVEWVQIPWDHSFGGSFQYVDEDEVVMVEKIFPDNHIEYCSDEDDYNERLEDWLKENPGWVKTGYETWTNEIENEKFRQKYEEIKDAVNKALEEKAVHTGVYIDDLEDKQSEVHFENGIPQGE